MNFASNLRRLRNAAGLTQEQLAHACGFAGQSRIGNYESSSPTARQPRPDELPTIAAALGVSVGELFGEPAVSSPSHKMRLDRDTVRGVARAMQDAAEALGVTLGIRDAVEISAELYERVSSGGIVTADVVWLTKRLEQGEVQDEGGSGISNGSSDIAGKMGAGGAKAGAANRRR